MRRRECIKGTLVVIKSKSIGDEPFERFLEHTRLNLGKIGKISNMKDRLEIAGGVWVQPIGDKTGYPGAAFLPKDLIKVE